MLSLAFKNEEAKKNVGIALREAPGLAFLTLHTAECPQATSEWLGRQGRSNPSQLRICLCPTVRSELHTDNVQRATDPPLATSAT